MVVFFLVAAGAGAAGAGAAGAGAAGAAGAAACVCAGAGAAACVCAGAACVAAPPLNVARAPPPPMPVPNCGGVIAKTAPSPPRVPTPINKPRFITSPLTQSIYQTAWNSKASS